MVLHVTAYVSLFRSTAMGYGYPTYLEPGQVDFALLGAMNYVVAAFGILYVAVDAPFVAKALLHSPVVLAFGAVLLLTVAGSEDPLLSLRSFFVVLVVTLPALAIAARFGVDHAFEVVRRFCVFAVFLNLAYSLAFPHYAFQGGLSGFLRGMFSHKNAFGPFMAIAFVIVLPGWRGLDLRHLRMKELANAAACAIALVFVALSRSASAWVMIAAFPGLYVGCRLILSIRNSYYRASTWLISVVSVSVAALLTYIFLFQTLLLQLGRDETLTNRTKIWAALLDLVKDKPWLGHGFGLFSRPEAFARYWGEFGWEATSTHSTYIELLLNIGYIPVAVLALIVVRNLWISVVHCDEAPRRVMVRRQVIIVLVLISGVSEASRLMGGSFFWLVFVTCLFVSFKGVKPSVRARAAGTFYELRENRLRHARAGVPSVGRAHHVRELDGRRRSN